MGPGRPVLRRPPRRGARASKPLIWPAPMAASTTCIACVLRETLCTSGRYGAIPALGKTRHIEEIGSEKVRGHVTRRSMAISNTEVSWPA